LETLHDPLVYYVRLNGLIKIGTTTQFRRRMHSLGAEEYLAVEPGTYALELKRHHEFAAYRVEGSGELFKPATELLAHAAALLETYGLPNWRGILARDLDPEQSRLLALLPPAVMAMQPGTLERFVEKFTAVDPAGGCWRREVDPTRKGYGRFSLEGRRYESHVASYMMFVGPVPEGMVIDHLCHDPDECDLGPKCPHRSCVNPAHLKPETNHANSMRGTGPAAKNARKTHCMRGHEFTPENTYTPPGGGGRACKTCMYAWSIARTGERKLGDVNRVKTLCPQGHPYDEENTYWTTKGRTCKECQRASLRRSRARKRAKRAAAEGVTDGTLRLAERQDSFLPGPGTEDTAAAS
jgi:HNH endonuclease